MATRKDMTSQEELEIYNMRQNGLTNREIAEKTGWSYSKVTKLSTKFKKGYIPQLSETTTEVKVELSDAKELTSADKMREAFDGAVDLLYRAVHDAKVGYEIRDEMNRRVPIKTIMECIEKAGRYATTMAKAAESVGTTAQEVPWRDIAQVCVSLSENANIDFDEKAFIEKVLNTTYGKVDA